MKSLIPENRVIFLGAGRGSRLLPYTANCPKWQLNVGGLSILERQIACVHECGIADVVVVRGKAGGAVRCPSVSYVEDHACYNMVHSLFKARKHLIGDVVISYADILYEPAVIKQLLASQAPISVVVDLDWQSYFRTRADDPCSIAESLVLDGTRITSIGQPLRKGEMPQAQYIGLIKATAAGSLLLQEIYDDLLQKFGDKPWRNAPCFENAYMTDLLQEVIDRNVEVRAVPIHRGWVEFDTKMDYEHILEGIATGQIELQLRLDTLPERASVLSAGGVVVRRMGTEWEVLLVGDGSPQELRLPKGMQAPGEQIKATAIRGVKEKAGITTEIIEYIDRVQCTCVYINESWDERVHFFLMRPTGDLLWQPDSKISEVQWIAIEQSQSLLTFENECSIIVAAHHLLL